MNLLENFTYKYSDKFREICVPIFKGSPINFCSIARIFKDGTYSGFMSDPAWTELYIQKHYLPTLPLWIKNNINSADIGYDIWKLSSVFSINTDTMLLYEDCSLFNYNNGVNLIDEYREYYEVTVFCSSKNEGVENYFLSSEDILRNYILYIKDKIFSDNVLSSEFNKKYIVDSFEKAISLNQDVKFLTANRLTLNKYYVGDPLPENVYITKKELDCLLFFMLGINKKNISYHLNISIRTIETHLNNIKEKCSFYTLDQLKIPFSKNRYILKFLASMVKNLNPRVQKLN